MKTLIKMMAVCMQLILLQLSAQLSFKFDAKSWSKPYSAFSPIISHVSTS